MSVYVNLRCKQCKASLTGGYVADYNGIGEPIVVCRSCKTLNSHQNKCTEWALMSPTRKSLLMTRAVFNAAFYSVALFFVLFCASLWMEYDLPAQGIAGLGVLAALLCFIYRFAQLRRLIRNSDARMADETYTSRLRAVGLLR